MEVRGIRWIGVRTDAVGPMRELATGVLGLRLTHEDGDFAVLTLADGAKLELFGPAAGAAKHGLFDANPVVAGLLVDDIYAARDELARTPGVELLGDVHVMPGGYAWLHFRAPDGHAYELTEDPSAPGVR